MAEGTKKPNVFKRIGNFFREYRSEMKKVVWYPRKSVLRDTGIVVAALVASGALIFVVDWVLMRLLDLIG